MKKFSWINRLTMLSLCMIYLFGCTYPIKINNLNEFLVSHERLDERVKIGILSYNGPSENRLYFNMVVDALRRHPSTKIKQDLILGKSKGNFRPDCYLSILPETSYEGDNINFLTTFPGFLIFAPSWVGYKYSAEIHTTVEIFNRDGKKVDTIVLDPRYKFSHMDFERGFWAYTGWWIFYGAGSLVSAPFMVRYDTDATPLFQNSIRNNYGDFVAESTMAALKPLSSSLTFVQSRPVEAPVSGHSSSADVGLRWAVVIGISRYQHAGAQLPNIRYADKDAEAFYQFLTSEQGGRLANSNVRLLLNEEATFQNMREALFNFLSRPIEEDIVYIYFSGHGAPEPGDRDNLYLLPYDTDPSKIVSTAFPMRDIEAALEHHIKAKRVLVLADACHAGGIESDFDTKGIGGTGNPINNFLKLLSETRPGRTIITASEAEELSREGEKWGGGHGVFTYHLLEGLQGAADSDGDKIVTLGEAFMYTDKWVRRDTNSQQHPCLSGKIDMNMPLAITK